MRAGLRSAKQPRTAIGYVSITTWQASASTGAGKADKLAGRVVVRFYDEKSQRESFTLTDEHGSELVPLREGVYCTEAFGTDGSELSLDSWYREKAHRCIAVRANQTVELNLILAYDVRYSDRIPSLGVR
jgi:hypothetical protein